MLAKLNKRCIMSPKLEKTTIMKTATEEDSGIIISFFCLMTLRDGSVA